MLNDAVLLEIAQGVAKRVVAREGKMSDQVTYLYRLCLVRSPTANEVVLVTKFYESQRKRFSRDPKRAAEVAGAGDDVVESAAWTATARAILNLDEFLTRK